MEFPNWPKDIISPLYPGSTLGPSSCRTSHRRYTGEFLLRFLTQLNCHLSMWRSSGSPLSTSWMTKLLTLPLRESSAAPWRKLISTASVISLFRSELLAVGEGRSIDRPEKWQLCFQSQLSLYCPHHYGCCAICQSPTQLAPHSWIRLRDTEAIQFQLIPDLSELVDNGVPSRYTFKHPAQGAIEVFGTEMQMTEGSVSNLKMQRNNLICRGNPQCMVYPPLPPAPCPLPHTDDNFRAAPGDEFQSPAVRWGEPYCVQLYFTPSQTLAHVPTVLYQSK